MCQLADSAGGIATTDDERDCSPRALRVRHNAASLVVVAAAAAAALTLSSSTSSDDGDDDEGEGKGCLPLNADAAPTKRHGHAKRPKRRDLRERCARSLVSAHGDDDDADASAYVYTVYIYIYIHVCIYTNI